MSPYVGSPLSLGGAECSERDESGTFSTFRTDVGVWKAHTTSQGGGWGFYLAVWHSTKASGVTTERGWERALKPPLLFLIFDPALNLIKWLSTLAGATSSDCFSSPGESLLQLQNNQPGLGSGQND